MQCYCGRVTFPPGCRDDFHLARSWVIHRRIGHGVCAPAIEGPPEPLGLPRPDPRLANELDVWGGPADEVRRGFWVGVGWLIFTLLAVSAGYWFGVLVGMGLRR
jgi:hypothetical protein